MHDYCLHQKHRPSQSQHLAKLHAKFIFFWIFATYSEVPDRQAGRNKQAGLKINKSINEQLLHKKLQAGWKENLKNFSKHALLLGTSEYMVLFGHS